MQLLQAEMDRIRFSVRRRSPRLVAAVLIVGAAFVGTAGLVPATALWRAWSAPGPALVPVPPPLDCPGPSASTPQREACAVRVPELGAAPGLAEAYLARRHHHLTQLLPIAFPPADAPTAPAPAAWLTVGTDADHALVAEVIRDVSGAGRARVQDHAWTGRDPVIGTDRIGARLPDDDAVWAAIGAWAPTLPPLPDRTGATLEQLVEERVVRDEGPRRSLFSAPEGDHVVERAVADVRRYAALRRAAFHVAVERQRAEVEVENALRRANHAALVDASGDTVKVAALVWVALAAWIGMSIAVSLAVLRRQAVTVTFDGHGLRLGATHLPWDDLVDLAWYEGRVHWTTHHGEGELRGLALSEAEARALHKVCWSLRSRRSANSGDAAEALASLRSLVGRAGGRSARTRPS